MTTVLEVARFPDLLLEVMPVSVATKGPGHVEEKLQPAPARVTASVAILTNPDQAVIKVEGIVMGTEKEEKTFSAFILFCIN